MRKFILQQYRDHKRLCLISFLVGVSMGILGGGFVAFKFLSKKPLVHTLP